MDFFSAQEKARKRTKWMVLLFILAVAAITAAMYVVVLLAWAELSPEFAYPRSVGAFWQPDIFAYTAVGVLALIGGASVFKLARLRAGGAYVARSIGGTPVDPASKDPDEQRFANVVEEMAIASGVPVPEIFILEEAGINAFAAGFEADDAVIAVTRGALQTLDREELQGVVAHEFSHILNGDMRLNLRLMGVLFGILVLAVIGRGLLSGSARASLFGGGRGRRSTSESGGKGGGGLLFLLVLSLAIMVIGYIGVFFGRMIQSAISRQREYLADAAAVQFTRNPESIGGALKKIGGHALGGKVANAHSEETAHFFFTNAFRSHLGSALATHPPLRKRIRAVDPQWDGKFVGPDQKRPEKSGRETEKAEAAKEKTGGGPAAGAGVEDFLQSVGILGAGVLQNARRMRGELESSLEKVRARPETALAVVIGLQITASPETDDAAQLESVREALPEDVLEAVRAWLPELRGLKLSRRFLLFEVALPLAIRGLEEGTVDELPGVLRTLAHSDGEVRLEELALLRMARRKVAARKKASPSVAALKPSEMQAPLTLLLSAVARASGAEEASAENAFAEGLKRCGRYLLEKPRLMGRGEIDLDGLEKALDRFVHLPMPQKRVIFESVLAVVLADGRVDEEQLSLIRLAATALALPMPPLQADA